MRRCGENLNIVYFVQNKKQLSRNSCFVVVVVAIVLAQLYKTLREFIMDLGRRRHCS